jgi:hypothetical protein
LKGRPVNPPRQKRYVASAVTVQHCQWHLCVNLPVAGPGLRVKVAYLTHPCQCQCRHPRALPSALQRALAGVSSLQDLDTVPGSTQAGSGDPGLEPRARLAGGAVADYLPYVVALRSLAGGALVCGASLIAPGSC